MSDIKIYSAKAILTLNPAQPRATHIAVKDGRILAVGGVEEASAWGGTLVDSLADKVLMPGLVEGHCHAYEGSLWEHPYVGFYDRRDPDGKLWPGLKSIEAVIERLREADAHMSDPELPIFAWGFDPIFFGSRRANRKDFDKVSTTRSVAIIHSSLHLFNVNSALIQRAGIKAGLNIEGVEVDADGEPTGELREMAAMFLVYKGLGAHFPRIGVSTPEPLWRFARLAQMSGVTTATDLYNDLTPQTVENYQRVTSDPAFPIRVVPALNSSSRTPEEGIKLLTDLKASNTPKLHFGIVKVITDGSVQGYTARLKWPHYKNGKNGVWNISPDDLYAMFDAYHRAGFQIHVHVNGDEASETAIEVFERVLLKTPQTDHRHTLQHCQLIDRPQMERMQRIGLCANIFANHVFYYGDQHYEQLLGPDRANRLDPVGSALRHNISVAIHSDAPVTPLAPLFTASCAVNRRTNSGRILGKYERIEVDQALHAITLGAARTLKLDHEIGSLEIGKLADLAILEDDPHSVAPEQLGAIPIWGTMLGGDLFKAPPAK